MHCSGELLTKARNDSLGSEHIRRETPAKALRKVLREII
jgi:hypothetical protein